MKPTEVTIRNVDPDLLRLQRYCFQEHMGKVETDPDIPEAIVEALRGLQHLLDDVQDTADITRLREDNPA